MRFGRRDEQFAFDLTWLNMKTRHKPLLISLVYEGEVVLVDSQDSQHLLEELIASNSHSDFNS